MLENAPKEGPTGGEPTRPRDQARMGRKVGFAFRFLLSATSPLRRFVRRMPLLHPLEGFLMRILFGSGKRAPRRVLGGPLRGAVFMLDPSISADRHMWLGIYEAAVLETLGHELRRVGARCAYDIGAGYGYHTLFLSRVLDRGRVISFEPNPSSLEILWAMVADNAVRNVEVIEAGVGAHAGSVMFRPGAISLHGRIVRGPSNVRDDGPSALTTVPMTSLDEFVFEKRNPPPDLLKIDVEGAELDVLRGGERVLQAHRPVVVCELHGLQCEDDVQAILSTYGYAFHVIARRGDAIHILARPPA